MDTLHEDVRSVSGIYFHMVDIPDEMRDIAYILSPRDRATVSYTHLTLPTKA